ncbi:MULTISPECIES: hypothetical protein [unclassified Frondihabitans]|uniref:hypothetical protein n=1 Tax=unclassified Frondihabitans TaxID=2626248 RepID=UPI000F50B556|nr:MULTISPECIES: hypothetical protein [unclassified Frondihabitans]RPE77611.1 hypothetical protein EDF37_0258 [Frondihabitans sp. PhB153]RPF07888.1 hypothetical protein EDF39_0259 [Frondihabitans sp. PhB161]
MRSSTYTDRHRPRSVWFALGTGFVVSVLIVAVVLLPILGLIGASVGAVWFIHLPIARITVTVIAGYLLALGFLALILRRRNGPLAWILAVAAIISTLIVSIYPAVAVSLVAVHDGTTFVPWAINWIRHGISLIP